MKLWIYENHTCELRSEELYQWRSSQLYTQPTSAAAKRKPEKKIQACTGFKPLTSAIWEIGWRPARISNSSEDRRKASNKGSQRSSLKKGTISLLVRVRAHVSGGKGLIAYHGGAVQWFYRSTTPFSRSWMIILVNYVQKTPTWNLSL